MEYKIDSIISGTKNIYQEGSNRVTEVKSHMLRLLPFWIAGSVAALAATAYAKVFAYTEDWSLKIYDQIGLWYLVFVPLCFFLSWILVYKYSPYANGSGIPQLMTAVVLSDEKKHSLIDRLLGVKVIVIKVISSLIAVLGGGAIGREGPTLQISGSIFHLIDKKWKFSDQASRNGFLLAGAASGLASAFNTPLGGIVYVIEELAKSHLSSFRTGVIHAVIFAGLISQLIMGPYLYFGYPKIDPFEYSLIFEYTLLAFLASVIVTLFAQGLKSIVKIRGRIKGAVNQGAFAIISGLLFALLVIFISRNAMGPGRSLLNDYLFKDQTASITDIIARFFGTMFTYANGGAGGIFAPTLSLGGAVSSFMATILNYNLGPLTILVGMTAGLAALTHSPLTSFILILEMTDRHNSIFPLMIAAMVGHGISKLISKQSFYEFVAERILHTIDGENRSPRHHE